MTSHSNDPVATRWARRQSSAISVRPPPGHYVFVAPHPDDETLAVGGLLSKMKQQGAEVEVVAVTNGGSAYPNTHPYHALAELRHLEQLAALEQLGVEPHRLTVLDLVDGGVRENEAAVADAIAKLCDESTTIVAPWTGDVHPDHEAVGRAARTAARRCSSTLWFSLFWAWHRLEATALDDERLVRVSLTRAELAQKAAAIECHESQLRPTDAEPVLDVALLEPLRWNKEYYIVDARSEQ